jgi:putative membrane protein
MMAFGGIGLFLMVLFWGALIFGGVWFVKTVFSSAPQNHIDNTISRQASPREILDQRYARGEINQEEYERIKSDLA